MTRHVGRVAQPEQCIQTALLAHVSQVRGSFGCAADLPSDCSAISVGVTPTMFLTNIASGKRRSTGSRISMASASVMWRFWYALRIMCVIVSPWPSGSLHPAHAITAKVLPSACNGKTLFPARRISKKSSLDSTQCKSNSFTIAFLAGLPIAAWKIERREKTNEWLVGNYWVIYIRIWVIF